MIEEELKPGRPLATDDEVVADIRDRAYSVFHPAAPAAWGQRPARRRSITG